MGFDAGIRGAKDDRENDDIEIDRLAEGHGRSLSVRENRSCGTKVLRPRSALRERTFLAVLQELRMSLQTFPKGRVARPSVSVLVIAILCATQIAAAQGITAQQAAQLQRRLLDAMVAADWKTTADMMSDNLIYIHPNGLVNTKQQRLDPLLKGPSPVWTKIESKDVHVQVFSNTAIVTSETIFTHAPVPGSTQGQVLDLRFSTVWANEKGTWRMVLWHCTTIPPQKS